MQPLSDVARYVRSKNAGPFWVTIDIFCDSEAAFDRVCNAPSLSPSAVGALYGRDAAIVRIFPDRNTQVLKISFPRASVAGGFRDRDAHAGQYFVPLLSAAIP